MTSIGALSAGQRRLAKLIFGILTLFVVVLSVAPSKSVPQVGSDKLGHLIAYACLQIVGTIAFPAPGHVVRLAVGLLILGSGLELVQSFLPSRSAEWLDAAANAAGVAIGATVCLLLTVWLRWLSQRRR